MPKASWQLVLFLDCLFAAVSPILTFFPANEEYDLAGPEEDRRRQNECLGKGKEVSSSVSSLGSGQSDDDVSHANRQQGLSRNEDDTRCENATRKRLDEIDGDRRSAWEVAAVKVREKQPTGLEAPLLQAIN